MIVAANCPFSLVDHPEFHQLMKMLRPTVKLPSRREVSGDLLDTIYEKEKVCPRHLHIIICTSFQAIVVRAVQGKQAMLSLDGWSNMTREPVLGVAMTVEGQTYFISTCETHATTHTSGHTTA